MLTFPGRKSQRGSKVTGSATHTVYKIKGFIVFLLKQLLKVYEFYLKICIFSHKNILATLDLKCKKNRNIRYPSK